MNRLTHSPLRCCALALLFTLVAVEDGFAKTDRLSARQSARAENPALSTAALDLAGQVGEIAHSSAISRAKKEKRISTAVRIAIVAATAYKNDPAVVLQTALEMTAAAAGAAPQYAEIIANAVSFAPPLARIDAAPSQIRTVAFAAAKSPRSAASIKALAAKGRLPASQPTEEPNPTRSQIQSVPQEELPAPPPPYVADSAEEEAPSPLAKVPMGSNSKFTVTADLSVSHDDNVFLTSPTAKVNGQPISPTSDTIFALTPGIDYTFGQNSLAHGSISYKNALTRYQNKSSPNVALSNGTANFGYDDGSTTVLGDASYQQLNQNNSTVVAVGQGQQAIIRQDILNLSASVEPHLTAKTSFKTGLNYSDVKYKTDGLIGSQDTEVPLKFYFETTPKVSVSAGIAYRRSTPQNDGATPLTLGPSSKDLDYSIGARGNFTAKLSGEFSLDYRTRTVGTSPKENLWGFNGNLNYDITPKTTSSLIFTRDFNIGALGESLKNSSYTLRLSSDPAPQWQLGTSLTYRQADYGLTYIFNPSTPPTKIARNDNSWDGNFQATYLFRSWLSLTGGYTFRHNSSTLDAADYNDNILSLILGWRY